MSLNTLYKVVDILLSTRRERLGRFASKGFTSAVTLDVENPWAFSSFMVSTAGDVVVQDGEGNLMKLPACQVGRQYWAVGVKILSSGTTATGIFVFGGV